MKKNNQSIFDTLINLLPNRKSILSKDHIDSTCAETLFSIWRTGQNKINNKTYKRPYNISLHNIKQMEKEDLIKSIGDKIEITAKGEKVLKIMILGDDRSSFEDSDIIIDYNTALNNVENIKEAKNNNWWDNYLKK